MKENYCQKSVKNSVADRKTKRFPLPMSFGFCRQWRPFKRPIFTQPVGGNAKKNKTSHLQ
ncbi:MAG: hypothetical protein CMP12_19785 [Zunongwangia sp.]|nr:hypothetical protein [Zunongwangia sp.]